MDTNVLKKVAMFHIGRGGMFNNSGHLSFVGFKKIDDCHDWEQNTFSKSRDEKSRFCSTFLTDCSGNVLMNADEYKKAIDEGIGTLDFDGVYDTTYTTYTEELSDDELYALSQNRLDGVDEILELYNYEV